MIDKKITELTSKKKRKRTAKHVDPNMELMAPPPPKVKEPMPSTSISISAPLPMKSIASRPPLVDLPSTTVSASIVAPPQKQQKAKGPKASAEGEPKPKKRKLNHAKFVKGDVKGEIKQERIAQILASIKDQMASGAVGAVEAPPKVRVCFCHSKGAMRLRSLSMRARLISQEQSSNVETRMTCSLRCIVV